MLDGDPTFGSSPADGAGVGLRPDASGTRLAIHQRRRRAAALAALAAFALAVGMVVGAASGGGSAGVGKAPIVRGYLSRVKTLAGNGPGSFAHAELGAENAAITRTLRYTPYVRVAGAQHREIALTFDDGPGPYTERVLATLEQLHTPATFFQVGISQKYFGAATANIVARGYPIGDHTWSHQPMSELTPRQQQAQLLQETSAIGDYGAPFPRMFRPPYGLWDKATLKLLRRYRMLMILWTVDTNDYQLPGVAAIVRSAVGGAKPGAIILMHDAGGTRTETIDALPEIVHALRRRGYTLVTVPRLLLDNPAPGQQDVGALGAGG
ncbi:MAG: polysaccharide deacetylase family protein [Solirubrobacterales bacterium]|nr:polysaccharide deacetylase family protein [Solirubrobacterales bacterium]